MDTPYADSIASTTTARIRTGAADTTAADLRAVFGQVGAAVAFLEGLSRGAKILKGNGAPSNADGLAGDAYVDLLTGDLHFKEGTWAFQLSLKGQPGHTPRKNIDYRDGYTPQKGVDYQDGANGKSAYQIWRDAGNTGNEAAFLASLKATDGGRGAQITSSESAPAPALTNQAGDVHFQTLSNERFRVFVFGADWQAIYTTPAGATVADKSITAAKMADDVAIGSISAAQNAFPQADRASLTTVEKFLVWLGGKTTDILQRLGASEAIIASISQSVSSNAGRIAALEARPTGGGGTGTGGATALSGLSDVIISAPVTDQVLKYSAGKWVNGTAAAQIELATNLTSNSDTKAPSVAAVNAAIYTLLRTRVNLTTRQGLRVAMIGVTGRWVLSDLVLFNNVNSAGFQLNRRVNGNWQPGIYRPTLSGINADLAALTDEQIALGVEMEIATDPTIVSDDLTVQFLIKE